MSRTLNDKAKAKRLSFEAAVAAVVITASLIVLLVAFTSDNWYWYHELDPETRVPVPVSLNYIGLWKRVTCTGDGATEPHKCVSHSDTPPYAKATAAFVTISLLIHLGAIVSLFLYIFWRRRKRFIFGTAIAIFVCGGVKLLSALIWGLCASQESENGWLDWAFSLILITMSLDWTGGLISIVEYMEIKHLKEDDHRRPPKGSTSSAIPFE